MGEPSIKEAKKALRKRTTAARKDLTPAYHEEASARMLAALYELPQYQLAQTVFLYASMPDEVQLFGLMEHALRDRKTVCLPLITGKGTMEAVKLPSMDDLVEGAFGIQTVAPSKQEILPAGEIDLIIVPGAAFDRQGRRLGLGAGYYDRFMAEKAPQAFRCGLTFDCQLVEEVPTEPHDQLVQYIITENEHFAIK